MSEESMWGEIPKSGKGIKRPLDYLNEQANILSRTYKSELIGDVTQEVNSAGRMTFDFDIRVPPLGSYRYSLLRVLHSMDIYPLTMYDLANKVDYKCNDEAQFEDSLRTILSSSKVREVIGKILTLMGK